MTEPATIGNGTTAVEVKTTRTGFTPSRFYHTVRAVALVGETRYEGPYTMFFIPGDAVELFEPHYLQTAQSSTVLFPTEDFTFELWFKATGPGALLREIDSVDSGLWNDVLVEILSDGVVKAGVRGLEPITTLPISFGAWNHLTVTYDGTTDRFAIYLNGQPAGASIGDRQSPSEAGRHALYSFGQAGPSALGPGGGFTGLLDEIRVWNRALTSERISSLYNRFGLSDLEYGHVATWSLDAFSLSSQTPSLGSTALVLKHLPALAETPLVAAETPMIPDQRVGCRSLTSQPIVPGAIRVDARIPVGVDYQFEYEQSGKTLRTPVRSLPSVGVHSAQEVLSGFEIGASSKYRLITRNSFGELVSEERSFVVPDWAGYALEFSGDDRLQTAEFTIATRSLTVELWMKPAAPGVVALFGFQSIIEVTPSGSVLATLPGLGTLNLGIASYGQWQHVALRYDSDFREMSGFLDGTKTEPIVGDRAANPGSHYSFGAAAMSHLGSGAAFVGEMDEIRVWHSARSDTDLRDNRRNLLVGDEPGLYFNWRLDAKEGGYLKDLRGLNPLTLGRAFGTRIVLSKAPLTFGTKKEAENNVELQFIANPNTVVRLQSSADLQLWDTHEEYSVPAWGLLRVVRAVSPDDRRFFRLISTGP